MKLITFRKNCNSGLKCLLCTIITVLVMQHQKSCDLEVQSGIIIIYDLSFIVNKQFQSGPTLRPYGLYPARLLCPTDFPGKNTGVGCHFLLQQIFLTQGLKPCLLHLLHWQADSLPLHHLGTPRMVLLPVISYSLYTYVLFDISVKKN